MTQSLTDNEFWASVPSIEDEPDSPEQASTLEPLRDAKASRRLTLKIMGTLGGALAMNVVSWLPPFSARRAAATVGTEHSNCSIYNYPDSQLCTPAVYSSSYCGSDGWFLNYHVTCFSSGPVVICGSPAKNAWRWPGSSGYRCADGYQEWCESGGSIFRICSWNV